MDFIIGLQSSKGFTVIYVIIDRLLKFGHFIPLKNDFSSTVVVEAFIHNVVKLHGVTKSIVSDRDRTFLSNFGDTFFRQWAQPYQCLLPIIHKRMGRLEL